MALEAFLAPFLDHFGYVRNLLMLCDRANDPAVLKLKGLVYQVDSFTTWFVDILIEYVALICRMTG